MTGRVRAGRAALLLLVGAAGACRFERRTDLGDEEPVITAALYLPADHPTTPIEDSVRAAVIALDDALGAGDSTRVAQLTTPDVILIDQQEEVRWTRAGGPLPRSLSDDQSLGWAIEGVSFGQIANGAALYSCLFETAAPGGGQMSAVESWIVVRTADGWRVRYLHRGRWLEPDGAIP